MKALIAEGNMSIMEIDMGHNLSEHLFGYPYSLVVAYRHSLRPSSFGMWRGF